MCFSDFIFPAIDTGYMRACRIGARALSLAWTVSHQSAMYTLGSLPSPPLACVVYVVSNAAIFCSLDGRMVIFRLSCLVERSAPQPVPPQVFYQGGKRQGRRMDGRRSGILQTSPSEVFWVCFWRWVAEGASDGSHLSA